MIPTEDQDDPSPDAEDLLAIAALTQDDIQAIDRALLSFSEPQWRKVAYIVSMAMDAYPDLYHDIPDVFYSNRIRQLVSNGQLESQGNLHRMRFSEVRLAPSGLRSGA